MSPPAKTEIFVPQTKLPQEALTDLVHIIRFLRIELRNMAIKIVEIESKKLKR